jgi:tight adherence protein C
VTALAAGLGLGAAALVVGATAPPRAALVPGGRASDLAPHRSAARQLLERTVAPLGRPCPSLLALVGVAIVALGLVAPPLVLLPVVVPLARAHLAARRASRQRATAIVRALPEVVDLLLLCAGAGLSLPLAHRVVAERAPAPLGDALVRAAEAAEGGGVRADALLDALTPLGDRAAALAHVLVDHLRHGVPLVPGLERIGLELRLDRRRRAEEEARRVPVRLLAPLVTCVLPAFGLLSVVPLLVASLRSLPR